MGGPPHGKWSMSCLAKARKISVKVNKRVGTPPTSETNLLAGWREYFSSLLNNSNSQSPSALPLLLSRTYRSWLIHQHTNTGGDTLSHMPNEDKKRLPDSTVQLQLKTSRMVVRQWLVLSMASVQFTPVSRHPTSGPPVSPTLAQLTHPSLTFANFIFALTELFFWTWFSVLPHVVIHLSACISARGNSHFRVYFRMWKSLKNCVFPHLFPLGNSWIRL